MHGCTIKEMDLPHAASARGADVHMAAATRSSSGSSRDSGSGGGSGKQLSKKRARARRSRARALPYYVMMITTKMTTQPLIK